MTALNIIVAIIVGVPIIGLLAIFLGGCALGDGHTRDTDNDQADYLRRYDAEKRARRQRAF